MKQIHKNNTNKFDHSVRSTNPEAMFEPPQHFDQVAAILNYDGNSSYNDYHNCTPRTSTNSISSDSSTSNNSKINGVNQNYGRLHNSQDSTHVGEHPCTTFASSPSSNPNLSSPAMSRATSNPSSDSSGVTAALSSYSWGSAIHGPKSVAHSYTPSENFQNHAAECDKIMRHRMNRNVFFSK